MEDKCHYISSRGLARICRLHKHHILEELNLSYDELLNKVNDGDSVYVWAGTLPEFMDQCIPRLKKKITLVSGDCDETIHTVQQYRRILDCPYIIKWFSQNSLISHEKVVHLPLGLLYHAYYDAIDKNKPWAEKIKTAVEQEHDIQQLLPSRPFWERKAKCYSTFHFYLQRGDRYEAYSSIPQNLIDYEPVPVDRLVSYKHQMDYAFVASPFGGGPDCHRTWEALLLGCIPIVKSSGMDPLFDDLPVLLVNRWSDVTQELLDATIEKFKGLSFNYEKLTLAYWNDKINTKTSPEKEYFLSPMINAMCSSDDTFKTNTSLGNVLFKISSAYALSKMTNRTFSNYYIKEFCERLKRVCNYNHGDTIFRFFLNDNIPSVIQTLTIEEKKIYDEDMINLIKSSEEDCIAIGNSSHLGYPFYFSKYRDDIVSIFSIPENILNFFKNEYKELFDPHLTPISIHMRLNNPSVPIAEEIQNIYYSLAIKVIFEKNITNPLFFIFSDNITKSKEIIEKINLKNVIYISNNLDYLDLYLISLCHHHITSASTFSWWAAYLSTYIDKMVIYPKYFYTHLSYTGISQEQFHREYYLDNAICI